MMFRKAYAIPLAAVLLAAAAPAPSAALARNDEPQNVSSDQSGGSDASTPKAERKICKTLPDTARRVNTKRLCMTQSQWREFNDALQE